MSAQPECEKACDATSGKGGASDCAYTEMAFALVEAIEAEQALQLQAILNTPAPRRRADLHVAYGDYFDVGGCLQALNDIAGPPGLRAAISWNLAPESEGDSLIIDELLAGALAAALAKVMPLGEPPVPAPAEQALLATYPLKADDDPKVEAKDAIPAATMWVPDRVEVKASALPSLGRPSGKRSSRKLTAENPPPPLAPDRPVEALAPKPEELAATHESDYAFIPPPIFEKPLSELTLGDMLEIEPPWELSRRPSWT